MPPARGAPTHPTFIRWLWIWITVGALVVVVVIGFLIGIVSNLKSIDSGLREANASVTGIGAEANPLPGYIQEINSNLTSIDIALKPITHQADQIYGALSSIHGGLGHVQSSLVNTSSSLVDTSGSLVNTSGTLGTISSQLVGVAGTLTGVSGSLVDTSNKLVTISGSLTDTANKLVTVRGVADGIKTTLNNAETVPTNGTQAIWRRVRFANGGAFSGPFGTSLSGPNANPNGLTPVLKDAGTILAGLGEVNLHLGSICRAPVIHTSIVATVLKVVGLVNPGPCP
jgi:hypothetical protein